MRNIFVFDLDQTIVPKGTTMDEKYFNNYLRESFQTLAEHEYECVINTARRFDEIEIKDTFYTNGVNYIITEVGMNIFFRNQKITKWNEYIHSVINKSVKNSGLYSEIIEELENNVIREKLVTPFYLNLRLKTLSFDLSAIENIATKYGYYLLKKDNQIKLLYSKVNKGSAFLFLKNYLQAVYAVGIGDSIIDDLFLNECNKKEKIISGSETMALSNIVKTVCWE